VTQASLAGLVRATAVEVVRAKGLDESALPETVTVERPRNPEHGDYATNLAMQAAGGLGVSPLEFARWLSAALGAAGPLASADVAEPGFVNLRLTPAARGAVITEVLSAGDAYGRSTTLTGRTICLEIVAARSSSLRAARVAAAGEVLAGVLAAAGAAVTTEEPGGAQPCLRLHDQARGQDSGQDTVEVLIGQPVNVLGRRAVTVATKEDLVDAVGADEARYALVRSTMDSPLEVDLDSFARQTEENPAFNVRYAHARLVSTLRNARELGIEVDAEVAGADYGLLNHDREGELTRIIDDFPAVLRTAAELREPHRVARYCERLAAGYHRFTDAHRVLPQGDEQPDAVTMARLGLCAAAGRTLAVGLGLLGVGAPERI
jgi:arginyl-tRNA synthetase